MEDIDTEPEAPKTEILDLPVEVRDCLMSYLDYSSRRTCRLVCRPWKESVDGVGLSIKIDDRENDSLELCRSVNATEVQVQHMLPSCPVVNLNSNKWRTVILSGPIHSGWLNASLQRQCPNLRFLMLTGDCLTSQVFQGPMDLPIFQHLTQLRFNYHRYHFQGAYDLQAGFSRLKRNMLYLLMSIRSRVLKVLDLSVGFKTTASDSFDPHHWQNKGLFHFIEKHRNSLKEINATNLGTQLDFRGYFPPVQFTEEQEVYQIPTRLKQFYWSIDQPHSVALSSFWRELLLSQESLEKLHLEYADVFWLPLERILFTSVRTLKVIVLKLNRMPVLDMSLFSHLEALQKVEIKGNLQEYDASSVIHLNQLPRARLTFLKLSYVQIEDDFDAVEFMNGFRPETLKLKCLSTSGLLGRGDYLRHFVKLVLRCRSLNVLHLTLMPPNRLVMDMVLGEFRTLLEEKFGLNLWLSNLSAHGPENHLRTRLDIRDSHNYWDYERDLRAQDRMQYTECVKSVNINYLELIKDTGTQFCDKQEQPFNFPRNAESYTIWKSPQENSRFRILPNYQPYTKRVNDIGRIQIRLLRHSETSIETQG